MRGVLKFLFVAAALLLLPTMAQAQGTLTGTVRDTSGAVMPGVTVEASSPALIEKVRTVVTDGTGQYRIIALNPGRYTLTFTLPGFTTIRREGIEVAGEFGVLAGEQRRDDVDELAVRVVHGPVAQQVIIFPAHAHEISAARR